MRLEDRRPAFAGLANLTEQQLQSLPTPCYLLDEAQLRRNGQIMLELQQRTGCRALLAQKAFSNFDVYPVLAPYLAGTEASGLYESHLGREELPEKENHVFCAAYRVDEFAQLLQYADHIVFNSPKQWQKFKGIVEQGDRKISCGIRCNPEYSEIETDIYNPCFKNSRLGTTLDNFDDSLIDGIDGLHFHTMCEQGSDVLKRTIPHIEEKFGKYLYNMKWINLGGGHHITRDDYDLDTLIECVNYLHDKYGVQVYLEPGEAVALNAGYLVSEVIDTAKNGMDLAILDASAACHMPDVLEMPYRPNIIGSGQADEKAYTYRLGGPTCLAGDIIGDYSFDKPLKEGDRLVFCDMAIYSMCKNNTFNGMPLPSIYLQKLDGELELIKEFGYDDFKMRL